MPIIRHPPRIVLLPAVGMGRRSAGDYAGHRRGVYEASLSGEKGNVRISPSERLPDRRKANANVDERNGVGFDGSRTVYIEAASEQSQVPVFAQRPGNYGTKSSLGDGHNVHPTIKGVRLFNGGSRLVQPIRNHMGVIDNTRQRVLHPLRRGCVSYRLSGNF